MVSLADVRKHPEWKNEYLKDTKTNFVNICKSCGLKAIKGCCMEYLLQTERKLR